MSPTVIDAALQACSTLDGVIESLFEDEDLADNAGVLEIRAELCKAYNDLTATLSTELGFNTRHLLRDVATADIEAWRAILKAKGLL